MNLKNLCMTFNKYSPLLMIVDLNLWRKAMEKRKNMWKDSRYKWEPSLSTRLSTLSRLSVESRWHPLSTTPLSSFKIRRRLPRKWVVYSMDFWFCFHVELNCLMKRSHRSLPVRQLSTLSKKIFVISKTWRHWTWATTKLDLNNSKIWNSFRNWTCSTINSLRFPIWRLRISQHSRFWTWPTTTSLLVASHRWWIWQDWKCSIWQATVWPSCQTTFINL